MVDVELRPLRRKKGANFYPKESPFPVPIQSITRKESCDERWYFYKGYFRDNCVVIEDLGDVTFLFRMGFFGKGSLSKSKAEHEAVSDISQKAFSRTEKIRRLPPNERKIRQSKFREIRKERFRNHLGWSNAAEQSSYKLIQAAKDLPDRSEHDVLSAKRRKTDHELRHDEEDSMPQENSTKDDITDRGQGTEAGTSDRDRNCEDSDQSTNSSESCDNTGAKDGDTAVGDSANMTGDASLEKERKKERRDRIDPYKVYEQLQLTLEEAFFLSYGLGCLSVLKEGKVLPLREMWMQFCTAQQGFIANYVAYHYFRSKGWVPKIGIKYGADFVLYREGMSFYHSSYSVVVQLVESGSLDVPVGKDESLQCRQVTWADLYGLSRVNEHAAKEVLICYVIKPKGLTEEELSSPDCIARFKVQEVVMRRWVPEKAREPDKKAKKGS